jgi:hypothetical protein
MIGQMQDMLHSEAGIRTVLAAARRFTAHGILEL